MECWLAISTDLLLMNIAHNVIMAVNKITKPDNTAKNIRVGDNADLIESVSYLTKPYENIIVKGLC